MVFEVEKAQPREIYNLLIGLVAPRPIALVTSRNEDGGLNAAPFSAYNYLCTDPPIVGLGVMDRPGGEFVPKDTARNIRRRGEFVVNVVTEDLLRQMNVLRDRFSCRGERTGDGRARDGGFKCCQRAAHSFGARGARMRGAHHP